MRVNALLDTGSRISTVSPKFVKEHDLAVLPLSSLFPENPDYQVVVEGVAGMKAVAQGYTYLYVEGIDGVEGYHDYVIALVLGSDGGYSDQVPIILGMPCLKVLVSTMKESEMKKLPPALEVVEKVISLTEPIPQMKIIADDPTSVLNTKLDVTDLNEEIKLKKDYVIKAGMIANVKGLVPLMMQGYRATVIIQPHEKTPNDTPPGVKVLNTFETMHNGSKIIQVAVANESKFDAVLRKGYSLGRIELATRVPCHAMAAGVISDRIKELNDLLGSDDKVEPSEIPVDGTAHTNVKSEASGSTRLEYSEESAPKTLVEDSPAPEQETPVSKDGPLQPENHTKKEPLTIRERQEKLESEIDFKPMEKLGSKLAKDAKDLILEFHDIFSLDDFEIGETEAAEHEIKLSDPTAFKERFRRIPPPLIQEVKNHIKEMLDARVITPSESPWCNAVVLVRKKDGSLRFCIDFRRLNSMTIKDCYALPRIDETLDSLQGSSYFSSLDLKSGFWQIPMAGESRQKTAFSVGNLGFFEFLRMPFGLTNAPATFQRAMEKCLGDMNLAECLIYLDDVVVFSGSPEDHLKRLRRAFERFRHFKLKLKPSKCEFFKEELTYVGHVVNKDGIHPDTSLVDKVLEMGVPNTYTLIRRFLGMVGYYRKFIKGHSKLAAPLNEYLQGEGAAKKSEKVELSEEAIKAFNELKLKLTTAPVLQLADFKKPFLLETDASGVGLGAVLSQKGEDGKYHPVAYGSRSLKAAEKNYHSTKLEFLALFWAVTQKFPGYLRHCPGFEVRTDNNPLTYVMKKAKLDGFGHRWVADLQLFDFSLKYQRGVDNTVADVLSRYDHFIPKEGVKAILDNARKGGNVDRAEANTIETLQKCKDDDDEIRVISMAQKLRPMHVVNWSDAQRRDEEISAVMEWMRSFYRESGGNPPSDRKPNTAYMSKKGRECFSTFVEHLKNSDSKREWSANRCDFRIRQGMLYKRYQPKDDAEVVECFVVPKEYRITALNGCHRDAGHQGRDRTMSLLRERFWWPGMRKDMLKMLEGCERCRAFKAPSPVDPMRPIVATSPMELVHVDFTSAENTGDPDAIPKTHNLLVIQDHFTKFVTAFVTPDQKASTVAKYLWEGFFSVFGPPARLISDQGATFLSNVIAELCKLLQVEKIRTTAYHPMGNGQVERIHQTIFRMLGTLENEEKDDWPKQIKALVFAYNSTRNATTGYSPHFLMYGIRPRIPVDFLFPTNRLSKSATSYKVDEYVANLQLRLKQAFDEARFQATLEADRHKIRYDRRGGSTVLQKGDRVLLRSDALKGKRKIKDRWGKEVLTVVERIGSESPIYRVRSLDDKTQVVHRNRLLFITRGPQPGVPLVLKQLTKGPRSPDKPIPTEDGNDGPSTRERTDEEAISITVAPVIGKVSQLGWLLGGKQMLSWPELGLAKLLHNKELKMVNTKEGDNSPHENDSDDLIAADEVS